MPSKKVVFLREGYAKCGHPLLFLWRFCYRHIHRDTPLILCVHTEETTEKNKKEKDHKIYEEKKLFYWIDERKKVGVEYF